MVIDQLMEKVADSAGSVGLMFESIHFESSKHLLKYLEHPQNPESKGSFSDICGSTYILES